MNNLDIQFFYAINHLTHNALLDNTFLWIHYLTRAGLIYYPLLVAGFLWGNTYMRRFTVYCAGSMLLTYITSDLIIKNIVQRPRPFQAISDVIFISPAPHSYSFPSGQASVVFAIATMFFLWFPKYRLNFLVMFLALLVTFDRVYLGHHYPTDVIFGAFLGITISCVVYYTTKMRSGKFETNKLNT